MIYRRNIDGKEFFALMITERLTLTVNGRVFWDGYPGSWFVVDANGICDIIPASTFASEFTELTARDLFRKMALRNFLTLLQVHTPTPGIPQVVFGIGLEGYESGIGEPHCE